MDQQSIRDEIKEEFDSLQTMNLPHMRVKKEGDVKTSDRLTYGIDETDKIKQIAHHQENPHSFSPIVA